LKPISTDTLVAASAWLTAGNKTGSLAAAITITPEAATVPNSSFLIVIVISFLMSEIIPG
jgi:hypothetical protein